MATADRERRYARVFMSVVADDSLEKTETQTAARAGAAEVPRPVTLPPLDAPHAPVDTPTTPPRARRARPHTRPS